VRDVNDTWRKNATASLLIVVWYLFAWLAIRPLSDAPVVDSWIYQHAVKAPWRAGRPNFAGFTKAMPVGQVLYGVLWTRLFGSTSASFDLSVAVAGAAGALMMYALARRCGAQHSSALLATALLVCNPCYLFLSFSFMSEVPFLTLLIGCNLAFACADGARNEGRWIWLAAALGVAAFTIRPFGAAAILGMAIAMLLYERRPSDGRAIARRLIPVATALVACAAFWIWVTRENQSWSLELNELAIRNYFFLVPALGYFKGWLIGPLLYLGLVLAPLALVHAVTSWRRAVPLALIIFALAIVLTAIDDHLVWKIPECKCFGGWPGALVVNGMPENFHWHGATGWIVAALASTGAAGLCVVAMEVIPRMGRAAAAVALTAAIYWAGILPLWFFSDRYDLVMVPAGCLLLAIAPLRRGHTPTTRTITLTVAAAMTTMMGLLSLGGVYAYQRGAQSVVEARDALISKGVLRDEIDAGYSLNGEDLYRYPAAGIDTQSDEPGIPMITSAKMSLYTIAAAPQLDADVIKRFSWPGAFGFGQRPLYVLHRLSGKSAPCR